MPTRSLKTSYADDADTQYILSSAHPLPEVDDDVSTVSTPVYCSVIAPACYHACLLSFSYTYPLGTVKK